MLQCYSNVKIMNLGCQIHSSQKSNEVWAEVGHVGYLCVIAHSLLAMCYLCVYIYVHFILYFIFYRYPPFDLMHSDLSTSILILSKLLSLFLRVLVNISKATEG